MAERRMLTRKITDNDNFVNLPATAQALYLHLVMNADDDGFCSQIQTAMFRAHAKKKDLEALVAARYLLRFPNGVIVVKHWRMANTLRKDRHEPTVYQEEYKRLSLKDNGAYTMATERQPDGNQPLPQDSIDKNRIDKDRIEESSSTPPTPPTEDNDLPRVMTFFLDRVNPSPSPLCLDSLKQYTAALGADVVLHALSIALDERKTGWSYIQAILARYERDGLRDMEAVLQAEQKRKEKANGTGGNSASAQNSASTKRYNIHYDVDGS